MCTCITKRKYELLAGHLLQCCIENCFETDRTGSSTTINKITKYLYLK